jgi:hypothetical protein
MRLLATCGSSAILAAVLLQSAYADPQKTEATPKGPLSATLEVESEQMRLIAGGTAGKGTLRFKGKDYAFTFKTSSAGVGMKAVTHVKATGKVYGLTKIEDFPGRYTSLSKAMIAGSSKATATYKADNGVIIDLQGTVKGAGLSLGAGMATIKLIEKK